MPRSPMTAQAKTRAGLRKATRRWAALLGASSAGPLDVVHLEAKNRAGVPIDIVVTITVRPLNPEATP